MCFRALLCQPWDAAGCIPFTHPPILLWMGEVPWGSAVPLWEKRLRRYQGTYSSPVFPWLPSIHPCKYRSAPLLRDPLSFRTTVGCSLHSLCLYKVENTSVGFVREASGTLVSLLWCLIGCAQIHRGLNSPKSPHMNCLLLLKLLELTQSPNLPCASMSPSLLLGAGKLLRIFAEALEL